MRSCWKNFLPPCRERVQAAFEFRHDSWFSDEIFNLLKKHNRALCIAETEERITPDVVTADFCYYRYRKPSYTADERRAMVERIREHLGEGRDVFAYFKHEETPEGAMYAVEILKEKFANRSRVLCVLRGSPSSLLSPASDNAHTYGVPSCHQRSRVSKDSSTI